MTAKSLSDRFGILRGSDAEFLLELPGEVMHGRILQRLGDLREIHMVFPDHLLALLQFCPADILTGRDL